MLRLVPAGGIAYVCLLVVQQKQMSTRVNIPVARRGNVVVSLLRLEVQLRDVATGTSREKRCALCLATGYPADGGFVSYTCWFGKFLALTVVPADYVGGNALLLVAAVETLDSSGEALPFRTSFRSCNWLVEEREVAAVRVLRRSGRTTFWFSLRSIRYGFELDLAWDWREILCVAAGMFRLVSCIAVDDFLPGCEDERQYRTLISLLGSLATMRRVVNYHSSWARQQQVELFDASGNPGSTAGRGFNPAGGAPGGG
ncbi:set domain protein [Dorcoceras hygrometricum]|uniref:Set domain protein n=1 Tax=Dorcoceras hygrometricum TaxID=472368 RepID=A0A2Z7A477_9LAMI|nr:set domain protein [Dorcoceras hygrometricum]